MEFSNTFPQFDESSVTVVIETDNSIDEDQPKRATVNFSSGDLSIRLWSFTPRTLSRMAKFFQDCAIEFGASPSIETFDDSLLVEALPHLRDNPRVPTELINRIARVVGALEEEEKKDGS